jgi:DNA (cytosine-5)-methyltransferase 1
MSISTVARRGTTVHAIDLFCGYGGSSQGLHASGADVRLAANHNQLAIDCHAANFPDTEHVRADLSDPDRP